MLSVNPVSVGGVANTIAVVANIQSLADPISRNRSSINRQPIDVPRGSSSIGIDITSQPRPMLRVPDQEHSLDRIKRSPRQLLQSVGRRRRSLGITFEEETMGRVGSQGTLDFPDDIRRPSRRHLGEISRVDGVVDRPARKLRLDVTVHRTESRGRSLDLAGTSGVDDGVSRAGGGDRTVGDDGAFFGGGGDGRGKGGGDGTREGDEGGSELDHRERLSESV